MATRYIDATLTLPVPQAAAQLEFAPRIQATLTLPVPQAAAQLEFAPRIQAALTLPVPQAAADLAPAPAVQAALQLPLPALSAQLRVQLRRPLALRFSLVDAQWRARLGLRWATPARDVAQVLALPWTPSQPQRAHRGLAWDGPRRLPRVALRWSLRQGQWQALAWRMPQQAVAGITWGWRWMQDCGLAWACAQPRRAPLAVAMGAVAGRRSTLALRWSASPRQRAGLAPPWSLRDGARRPRMTLQWHLLLRDSARAHLGIGWRLSEPAPPPAGRLVARPQVQAAVAGQALDVLRVSLIQAVADGLWHAQLEAGPAPMLARGQALTIAIGSGANTRLWRLVITEIDDQRDGDSAEPRRTVRASSEPALWSQQAVGELPGRAAWHGGSAAAMAQALAAPMALHWHVPDYDVPPPRAHEAFWGLPRWQAICRLARAAGACAMARADGSAIDVRLPGWTNHTAPLDVLEQRHGAGPPGGVRLADRGIADTIEVEPLGTGRALVRAVPDPVRPLRLSALAPVTLSAAGWALEEREDLLELRAGVGRLSSPAHRVLGAVVHPPTAGPLRWQADVASVWLDQPQDAAARVRWQRRVLLATAGGPVPGHSLVLTEDTGRSCA